MMLKLYFYFILFKIHNIQTGYYKNHLWFMKIDEDSFKDHVSIVLNLKIMFRI